MKKDPRKDPVHPTARKLAAVPWTGPSDPRTLGTSLGTGPNR